MHLLQLNINQACAQFSHLIRECMIDHPDAGCSTTYTSIYSYPGAGRICFFERTLTYPLYTPYSIYFRMVAYISICIYVHVLCVYVDLDIFVYQCIYLVVCSRIYTHMYAPTCLRPHIQIQTHTYTSGLRKVVPHYAHHLRTVLDISVRIIKSAPYLLPYH